MGEVKNSLNSLEEIFASLSDTIVSGRPNVWVSECHKGTTGLDISIAGPPPFPRCTTTATVTLYQPAYPAALLF